MKIIEIFKQNKHFPRPLLDLVDPPKRIFTFGDISILNNSSFGIEGIETEYGKQIVKSFVFSAVKKGLNIVSSNLNKENIFVVRNALEANAKIIVVIDKGFNHLTADENVMLYKEVINSGGCIVTECEGNEGSSDTSKLNMARLIAAFSTDGIILVESSIDSLNLITARYTTVLNRPLYAIPGSVFVETSTGTNQLIQNGEAKMITTWDDILYG